MINMSNIDTISISKCCNALREYLCQHNFVEISLFEITKYHIRYSNQIQTDSGDYLRSTTEPDIWQLGLDYNAFYCITSLFRDERLSSDLHKNEFKVLDFYERNSSRTNILAMLFNCMEHIEYKLDLPPLSRNHVVNIDFEKAKSTDFSLLSGSIVNIEHYPIEESFYDEVDDDTGRTKKGELFYVYNDSLIEFAVYGQVGENRNTRTKIDNFSFQRFDIGSKNIYGACLGIERILVCYEIMKELGG